jgi:hypothetical protein
VFYVIGDIQKIDSVEQLKMQHDDRFVSESFPSLEVSKFILELIEEIDTEGTILTEGVDETKVSFVFV